MSALVWLRTDLRSKWNSAIDYAVANHDSVTAVYFITKEQWDTYNLSSYKVALIYQRLANLHKELAERNIELQVIKGSHYQALPERLKDICTENGVTHVYCNAEYEWDAG